MNQLPLSIVFIQETFRYSSRFCEWRDSVLSIFGFALIECTNARKRRGIEFWIASHLKPFVLDKFCLKLETIEVLMIQVQRSLMIGSYIPDGKNWDGIQRWTEMIDGLKARLRYSPITALGDLNCRAQGRGNQLQYDSSPLSSEREDQIITRDALSVALQRREANP